MKERYNRVQLFCDLLSVVLLLATAAYLWLAWDKLPDSMPTHFNFAGEADSWGGKGSLLALPLIAFALYALLTAVCFFPKAWNMPFAVTEANRERLYTLTQEMLGVIKALCVATLCYIAFDTARRQAISGALMIVFLLLLFGAIIFYTVRMARYK